VSEPRTLAPFGRRLARVSGVEDLGPYRLLWADDAGGPADPRPGQFYMLAAAERWGGGADERPFLPRAFSHCRVVPAGGEDGAPRLGFVLDDVGPGTRRLRELGPGEGLWLTGPLGIGFAPPAGGTRPLLAGGGIGVAPLLAWQDELGPGAVALLGFRSAAHAQAARPFAGEPRLATDDGSAGRHGLVTELLREELDRDAAATVYACGPPAMLEAVRALCAEREVAAQLALEAGMACGFGACMGCVVATRTGYVRLCVDGPVLDAARLESALVPGAGH
jgi:dihydroorotate dehydrogenase electron transfer subunit